MSKDIIKKHSESITHNTIGGIVSYYIIQGLPTLLGFIAALSSYFRGLALWLVILIGSVVFFLLSLAWDKILGGNRKRKGGKQGESATVLQSVNPSQIAIKSDAKEGEGSESTLVCANTRITSVDFIDELCTESTSEESVRAAVVTFSNKGKTASMQNYVKARIIFYDASGRHLRHINNGAWLEEEESPIQYFDVGEVRELVIALVQFNDEVLAFGKEGVCDITHTGNQLRIEVNLVGGIVPATLGTFYFRLTIKPKLSIEQEKGENDAENDSLARGLIEFLHEGEKLLFACRGGRRTDSGFQNEIYVWILRAARFIKENYDETHREIFISHAPIEEYPIGDATPQERELLNKIYTRLNRLQRLLEERRKLKDFQP